jgi:hypothetical protein
LVPHILILAAASLLLAPVLIFREVANPAYEPARTFADRMEHAYRAVNAEEAEITDFAISKDGFEGGLFTIDRGGVVADYRLLVGVFEDDCYLVRWRQGRAPFVARLLPRYPCAAGDPALSFDPAGFEAVAINTSAEDPPSWEGVLPAQIQIATWVLPAVIALLYIVLRQLVSLSLVFIRGVPTRPVDVELIDNTD